MNWYTYCGNDPVNYTDPWGLEYGALEIGRSDENNTDYIDNYTPGIGNNDGDPGESGGSVESVIEPEVPDVFEIPDSTPMQETISAPLLDPEYTLDSGLSSVTVTTDTESPVNSGPSDSPSAVEASYDTSAADSNVDKAVQAISFPVYVVSEVTENPYVHAVSAKLSYSLSIFFNYN